LHLDSKKTPVPVVQGQEEAQDDDEDDEEDEEVVEKEKEKEKVKEKPQIDFAKKKETEERNKAFIKRLKEVVGSQEQFGKFRQVSIDFRSKKVTPRIYYEAFLEATGVHFRELFPELVALLPDVDKRASLQSVHTEHMNFETLYPKLKSKPKKNKGKAKNTSSEESVWAKKTKKPAYTVEIIPAPEREKHTHVNTKTTSSVSSSSSKKVNTKPEDFPALAAVPLPTFNTGVWAAPGANPKPPPPTANPIAPQTSARSTSIQQYFNNPDQWAVENEDFQQSVALSIPQAGKKDKKNKKQVLLHFG